MTLSPLAVESRIALARRGLTVTQLAARLGVSRPHTNLVLLGRRSASPQLCAAIGKELGATVAALLAAATRGRHGRTVTPVARRVKAERRGRGRQ